MKTLKIILAISVVSTIGYFIWKWLPNVGEGDGVGLPKNQYTLEIQNKIKEISAKPADVFCHQDFVNIQSSIDDFYKGGFLGKKYEKKGKIDIEVNDENNNAEWKKILSKDLYSAYAQKFVEQSMYVFNGTAWRIQDVSFIRKETNQLSSSEFLVSNSPIAQSFNQIKSVLDEYDQINTFINNCNNYGFNDGDIDANFPDVSDMISQAKNYQIRGFENNQLNNCNRLINDLKSIPQSMFKKHINYLIDKITENAPLFDQFQTQPEYQDVIYRKLKNQVSNLTNIYGLNDDEFTIKFDSLNNFLLQYSQNASKYFRGQPTNPIVPMPKLY